MNKKLRLIVTYDCPRHCEGCCNKDFVGQVPTIGFDDILKYDEIYITGGEPSRKMREVLHLVFAIRRAKPGMRIYLYTADSAMRFKLHDLLNYHLDGITYTLHETEDADDFEAFNDLLLSCLPRGKKSLRLNWFSTCKLPEGIDLSMWDQVVRDKEWQESCPVPVGEDLRQLDRLF